MNRWDKLYNEGAKYKILNEEFLNKLLIEIEKKSKKKPKTMIDLGCGTGDSLIKFIEKGFNVIGIDFSKIALKKAKDSLNKLGFDAKLIQMDLNNLNIGKQADVIFCKLVLAFIKNKVEFFKKVKTMMYEHSSFILITPVLHKGIKYTKSDKPGIAIDFEELKKLLSDDFFINKIVQTLIEEISRQLAAG